MSLSIFWTFLSLLYLFTLLVFFFLSQRGEFSVLYWSKADRDDFYAVLAVISSIIFILTFFGSLSPDPPIPSILFPLLFLSSLSLKSISLFRLLGAYKLSFLFSLCCFLHAVKTIWSKEKEETKEEEIGQILLQWTYSFLSQIPILSFFLPSSPPTLPYFIHYFFVVLSNMGISGWFFIWFHTLLYSLNHYISFMGPRYATKHITKISSFVVIFCLLGLGGLGGLLWKGEEGREGVDWVWGLCCLFGIFYAVAAYDLYFLEGERKRERYALGKEAEMMKKVGMNMKRGKRG